MTGAAVGESSFPWRSRAGSVNERLRNLSMKKLPCPSAEASRSADRSGRAAAAAGVAVERGHTFRSHS